MALMATGIDSQDGHIALHLAVRRCQLEVIKALISHGCLVDFQDRHGNTPLHVACKDGNLPIVVALCEANCHLDISNKVRGGARTVSSARLLLAFGILSAGTSSWFPGAASHRQLCFCFCFTSCIFMCGYE